VGGGTVVRGVVRGNRGEEGGATEAGHNDRRLHYSKIMDRKRRKVLRGREIQQ